jgi:molecular chaperone Hsp33
MEPHVAPAREVRDKCRCSPQRVENMLGQLDPADIRDLANAAGYVEIICEFCKTERQFHTDEIGTVPAPQ